MHKHQWVIITTPPAQPEATVSVELAKHYPMTAICRDPECREKRILIPAFDIHPGAGPDNPKAAAVHVPREWALMTHKAGDEELEAIKGYPVTQLS